MFHKLLSFTRIRSAVHVTHAHIFTVISRLAQYSTAPFGAVQFGVDLYMIKCIASLMCEEWTLCMFCTCQEQISDEERTHSMSAVGFGFSFRFVILENP